MNSRERLLFFSISQITMSPSTAVYTNDARPAWKWSKASRFEVRVADLAQGFTLPGEALAVVTEEEIFGPIANGEPVATA